MVVGIRMSSDVRYIPGGFPHKQIVEWIGECSEVMGKRIRKVRQPKKGSCGISFSKEGEPKKCYKACFPV